ncbi:MAG: endolytic transglycosylase MltG [Alphaproteobacteria bacterium]|nr:endolytic transglycosylase MltG [Alphaproteobacteria bacterium]
MAAGGRLFLRLFVLVVICLSGGSVFSFYSLLYEQNDIAESTVILVEKGENLNQIARRLKRDNLLNSVAVFKVAARLSGKSTQLKAGEYRIPARASAKEILDILVSGQTVVRRVTVPEGKTSRQIFDLLMQTPGLFGDLPEPPANGSLLPETYVFSYGLPRKVILERMLSGMNKTIEELWPLRDPDLPYTTKEEALVLASIVEKETSVPAERPRIAGVFVNRLRKGMRLQTDPTVIYAVTDGTMELNRRLTHKDLRTDHPFNTYVNKGLPPAPICNPGRESIQAVLQPQKTNEIYFVADGTGGHVFSRTFEEHKRNIANWKKARRRKLTQAARRARAAAVKKTKATPAKAAVKTPVKKTGASALPAARPIPKPAPVSKTEEILDQQDLSLDIVDDALVEQAAEKPVDPAVSQRKVPPAGRK